MRKCLPFDEFFVLLFSITDLLFVLFSVSLEMEEERVYNEMSSHLGHQQGGAGAAPVILSAGGAGPGVIVPPGPSPSGGPASNMIHHHRTRTLSSPIPPPQVSINNK